MKKKTITGIILLMSVSLFGIIGLQLYWLNHAIQVSEADFDRQVNDALTATAEKLEARETAQLVEQGMQMVSQQNAVVEQPHVPVQLPVAKPKRKPETVAVAAKAKKPHVAAVAEKSFPRSFTLFTDTLAINQIREKVVVRMNTRQGNGTDEAWQRKTFFKEPKEQVLVELMRCNPVVITSPDAAFTDSLLKNIDLHRLELGKLTGEHILQKLKAEKMFPTGSEADRLKIQMPGKLFADSLILPGKNTDWITVSQHFGSDSQTTVKTLFHKRTKSVALAKPVMNALPVKEAKPATPQREQIQPVTETPVQQADLHQPRQVIAERGRQLHRVMERMLVEMLRKDTPVEERLTLSALDSALRIELMQRQVQLPYELYVVSNRKEPQILLASAGYSPGSAELMQARYKAQLFPNSLKSSTDFLVVNFPGRHQYVLNSLWGMMLLSGVFTLVILFTFSSTLFYIFRQKKLSDIKTDFINNMTHEFKTPIATISLAVNNINNPRVAADPERVRQYTSIINQENTRMNSHVERVLQAALLDKKVELRREPLHLHACLQQAVETLKLQVESRGGEITLQLQAQHDLVLGDAEHLLHVLLNLLDNANKYSSTAPEISVSTRSEKDAIYVAVIDKGQGMSREVQKRIFEKFYRKPTGNVHNVKGFGLGLSYVKAIVEAHGGSISVRSQEGKGAEFLVVLPVVPGTPATAN